MILVERPLVSCNGDQHLPKKFEKRAVFFSEATAFREGAAVGGLELGYVFFFEFVQLMLLTLRWYN